MKNQPQEGDFQWLRIHGSLAGSMGLISGQGTKIPHSVRGSRKKKKREDRGKKKTWRIPNNIVKNTAQNGLNMNYLIRCNIQKHIK